jgi:hypothetical protein
MAGGSDFPSSLGTGGTARLVRWIVARIAAILPAR